VRRIEERDAEGLGPGEARDRFQSTRDRYVKADAALLVATHRRQMRNSSSPAETECAGEIPVLSLFRLRPRFRPGAASSLEGGAGGGFGIRIRGYSLATSQRKDVERATGFEPATLSLGS
jgi:hypothetical protein